ncbi:MAG: TolC family protein [Polyangia bacterium]
MSHRYHFGVFAGSASVSGLGLVGICCAAVFAGGLARAQANAVKPIPVIVPVAPEAAVDYEKISLSEAVRRALARNPTALVAHEELDRAQALLEQARSGSLPSLLGSAMLLRLNANRVYYQNGNPVITSPLNQQVGNLLLNLPIVAPRAWTLWSEASVNVGTTRAGEEDTRRTLAVAVARAYLAIIALKRQVDISARAVANDGSHYGYTHMRYAGGVGTRVDEVRAAQQLAADEALLSSTITALVRAREALSLLAADDRPVDTLDDLALPDGDADFARAAARRQDLRSARQRTIAAEKVRKDSWTDFMPTLAGQFQPFFQNPPTLSTPETGWQAALVLTFPLIEGGLRHGQLRERDALLAEARAQYDGLLRQTRSDLRLAVAEIGRADEAMRSSDAASDLAHQGLDLANLAYRAGATTNIEVIDAERRARDADTAAVVAEDNVRQARLDLLVAAGQFP